MKSRDAVLAIVFAMFLCNMSSGSFLLVSADLIVTDEGPYIDKLIFDVMPDMNEQVVSLLNGEIDIIGQMLDTGYLDILDSDPDITVESVPRNGYGYFVINCDRYPLNETALRRAWAFALDKNRITEEAWNGYSTPQDSVIPKGNPFSIEGQLTYSYYDANPTEGNRLLDAAGFFDIDGDGYREAPDGSDFTVVVEAAESSAIAVRVGELGEEALLSLGIDVDFRPGPFYEYLARMQTSRDYDVVFLGVNYDSLAIDWLAFEYWSENADEYDWNFPNFRNATFDSWRDQLLHSGDYSDVYEAGIEMQRILAYQCPRIICYNNLQFSAFRNDRFEGFVQDAIKGTHSWWTNYKVHLKESEGGPIGGTFTRSLPIDMGLFNIMQYSSLYEYDVLFSLYDTLLLRDNTGQLRPWLGESYTVETYWDNPNVPLGHTRLTFDIVTGSSWSDGMPLTAQDIAFTFNYIIEHQLSMSETFRSDVFSVYAPTDYKFILEFATESYWCVDSIGEIPIIPKHQWLNEDPYQFTPAWDELVTSGPFMITDRVSGEFIEMSYNPDYFQLPDRGDGEPIPPAPPSSQPLDIPETIVDEWEAFLETPVLPEERVDPVLETYIKTGEVPENVVTTSSGAVSVIAYFEEGFDLTQIEQFADLKWLMDLNLLQIVHLSVSSSSAMSDLSELEGLRYLSADKIHEESQTNDIDTASLTQDMLNLREFVGATGTYASAYTGAGVTIGLDDSGTDFSHPDLQDAMAVDINGYPMSYDPTGWGLQLMTLANSSYVEDIDAWLADGNVLTYEENGKYYLNVSTWDPVLNNNGGTRNLLGLLPPYGDGYPVGSTIGFIGLYEWYWGIPAVSEFVYNEMWKDWEIPIPTGEDYRVGWIFEQRWDRYAKVFAPALIMDNTDVIIDWNASIAWTQMWNLALYDETIDLTNQEDRDFISGMMDWSFTDDISEGYVFNVDSNNILAADVDDDGATDWGLGSFTWLYDDPEFFGDERLFCGIRSDAMAIALMYPSDNSHGQWTAGAIASRGVLEHDVFGDETYVPLPGIANGSKLIAVKGVTSGSDLGAAFWAAGFHLNEGTGYWEYTGEHKADIISNSWTYDSGSHLDLTYVTMTWDLISVPGFVDPANPGTLFLVSAGNSGAGYLTSSPPSTSGAVISVGATTTSAHPQIQSYSSNGPSIVGLPKPDIVAPGFGVTPSSFQNILLGEDSFYWWSGTSLSCPIAAGVAALILEALDTNGLPTDSVTVKEVLLSSGKDLGYDAFTQGNGLVFAESAISAIETGASDLYYFHNTGSYDNYAAAMEDAWSEWMLYGAYGIHQESATHPTGLGTSSIYFGNVYPGSTSSIDLTAFGYDGVQHGLSNFDISQPWKYVGEGPYTMSFETFSYDVGGEQFYGFHNLTEVFGPVLIQNLLNARYATLSLRYGSVPSGISVELRDWEDTDNNGVFNHYIDEVNFGDTKDFISNDIHDCSCLWMRLAHPDGISNLFDATPTLVVLDPSTFEGGSTWVHLEVSYWSPVNDLSVVVSDGGSNIIDVTLSVPEDAEPGIHQGFIDFTDSSSGFSHQLPYSYTVPFNLTAEESQIQQVVDRYGDEMEPYDNGAIESSHEWNSYSEGDYGGYRTFLIDVPHSEAGVLVFRILWDTPDTTMDLYLRSTSSSLLAQTNDGYSTQIGEFPPLYSPEPTEYCKNTLIYSPGESVAGKYYLTVAAYNTGGSTIPEDFSLSAQWFTSIPEPISEVTYTSLSNPIPTTIHDHDSISGDHIIVNSSWILPEISNFPELQVRESVLQFVSGTYYESTLPVVVPDDGYDPFSGGVLDLTQFSWQYVDVQEGDRIRVTVDFTIGDADIFVYWADTNPVSWSYGSSIIGTDLITGDIPETAEFHADRDGTIAFGCYAYSRDEGFWTLKVDTREYEVIEQNGSWVTYDTSFFGNNITKDVYMIGRNAAGMVLEADLVDITFNNFFAPEVEVLTPNGGEEWNSHHDITWSSTSQNIDHDFHHWVFISNDYGASWMLLARTEVGNLVVWDTTSWQIMDSYMVLVVTHDRYMSGNDASDDCLTAGNVPIPDSSPPLIEGEESLSYIQLFTGNELVWDVFDIHPDEIELWIDGSLDTTFDWRDITNTLTVNCDGLSPGIHNYTILAQDMANNIATATTWVTVEPDPYPVIYNYGDVSYIEGAFDKWVSWSIEDYNLYSYEIQRNGYTIEAGLSTETWHQIDVTGLAKGVYNFTIIITDTLGQFSVDTVFVSVANVIRIYSNADFVSQGWPGSGTVSDPYRIEDLSISYNGDGILIQDVTAHFVIRNCTLSSYSIVGGSGIYLSSASNGIILNCTFSYLGAGVTHIGGSDCTIAENKFINCQYGVYVYHVTGFNLSSNIFKGCGLYIHGDETYHWDQTIENNLVNGKPLAYIYGQVGGTFSGDGFGQLILADCTDVTVESVYITNTSVGVQLAYCVGCSIISSQVTDCTIGVFVVRSTECVVQDVTLERCFWDSIRLWLSDDCRIEACNVTQSVVCGISLSYCESTIIIDNDIHDSHDTLIGSGYGLVVDWANNTLIQDNRIFNNHDNGIIVHWANYTTVVGNTVYSNGMSGIEMGWSHHCSISNNQFYANNWLGVYVLYCTDIVVQQNTVYDNSQVGIEFEYSSLIDLSCNTIYGNTWASVRFHRVTDFSIVDNWLPNGNEDGIVIEWSSWGTIENNTVFNHNWYAFHSWQCDNLTIVENTLYENGHFGVAVENLEDCFFFQNLVYNNTDGGMWIYQSHNITILMNTITGNPEGLSLHECYECYVFTNIINDCNWRGAWIWLSDNIQVDNNTIFDVGLDALLIEESPYCTIVNNTIDPAPGRDCILVWLSDYTQVLDNHLFHSGYDNCGIHIFTSNYCLIQGNNIHHCYYGIALTDSHYNVIKDNILHFNDFYGIWISGNSYLNTITENYIGWNGWKTDFQGLDDGYNNNWNFNIWSYQQGPGSSITGWAGSFDAYPSEWIDYDSPLIYGPADITYSEGETGYYLEWENQDDYRWWYIILKDGVLIREGQLDYMCCWVEISVDGLPVGVYNYTMVVWDGYGNIAMDTVFVTVTDDTIPTINSPTDIEYAKGSIGNTISWTMSDDNPASYQIFLDGVLIDSGLWTYSGEIISLSVDGLSVGLYNYTIQITDVGGNSVFDTVFVNVYDDTVPTINHPADISYEQGETGFIIEWSPADADPVSYQILLDDVVIDSGPWTLSSQIFEVSVDGLVPGLYNYTIWVIDIGGNVVVDTVMVTVNPDTTPPVVTHPTDIEYAEGDTGSTITWNPSDLLPVSYQILLDDIVIKSGQWNSSAETVTIIVDGLGLGEYNYTFVATDVGGNSAIDTVMVTVVDGTVPTVDSPSDLTYEEGVTGNDILWTPLDAHPLTYEITKDAVPEDSGVWDGTPISIDIDGLAPGVYVYILTVYDIGGLSISDTVTVTVTDTVDPEIDSPSNIEYEEEILGNYITWTPSDSHPFFYEIYRNDTLTESDTWDGTAITINVDRLSPAVYNFTIVVYDESGNSISDLVFVTVTEAITDDLPPEIDHPLDIEYEEEQTGFSISWNPADANPDSYEILRNGTVLDSGSWVGEGISISVDGLDAALYNYTLVVHDTFSNWASDLVWVNVTPKFVDSDPPTIDSPSDIEYEEETTGHSIVWTPLDDYPVSYEIQKNGTIIRSGSWSGNQISIGVAGLAPDLYNYTLIVYDIGLNSVSDSVWVNVTEKFVDIILPTIDSPADVEYEEETTGHNILWTPLDDYPDHYQIENNGTLLESGSWDGSQIVVGIDGLIPNLYNFTVTVYDIGGNWIADTVFVNVTEKFVDSIPPTVDSPADIEYEEETTGHNILWIPLDDYPISYEILRDGLVIESDVWDGSQISIDIDGLLPGIYIFRLVVFDEGGNSVSNSVVVTVTEKFVDLVDPVLDNPIDIEYEEESTGNSITWNSFDEYPHQYAVYSNGTLLDSGVWDSGLIVVGIDGLEPNLYNYTLVVTDIGFNTATDMVWINVTEKFVDLIPPVVNSPSDIFYEEGDTGYSILWQVSDGYPGVYEILRDHVVIRSGNWYGPELSIGVDSLTTGMYNFTLVLYDESMNMAVDTVIVYVDPSLAPTINSPSDLEFIEQSTGHSITWVPNDAYPYEYKIYRDGALVKSGQWFGFAVSISVDGLNPGNYEYIVEVYDNVGHVVTDSVFVVVTFKISDWLPPTLDEPYDVLYEVGQTAADIVWHPDDLHPFSYKIYRNDAIIRSGDWDGEEIRIGISGQGVGTYNYTIIVIDESGNFAVDTVFVTVNDATVDVTPPYVAHLENLTYFEGATGNVLIWAASDANPDSYEITRDGILIRSGDWEGGAILVGVDRLPVEIYEYVLTVWDTHGHQSTSSTYVIVKQDGQIPAEEVQPAQETGDGPPVIDSPFDMQYEHIATGSVIIWYPIDGDPSDYLIQRNGIILEAGLWFGGSISIDVDGLEPGVYIYRLTVYDLQSDVAYDEVIVTVESSIYPSVTSPASITYEFGDVGYMLSWGVFDAYPNSYIILRNDVVVDSGLWVSGFISIDVDGLVQGEHEYKLMVLDQAGNLAVGFAYVTVEPSVTPIVNNPDDVEYDEDQAGVLIEWAPADDYPYSYEIWRDGTLLVSESWIGQPILVDVSGLEPGVYEYSLKVFDRVGNQASDSVIVTVNEVILDDTSPVITSPSDIEYEEGSMGHSITWSATDENPTQYRILRDGVLVESGIWDGSMLTLDINGLSPGTYTLTIILTDVNLNTASDAVIVTVHPSTPPTIDNPNDMEYECDMTGFLVIWTPIDTYPQSYIILRDGVAVKSGNWDGSPVQISVDGLVTGSYVYSITVYDLAGNSATDDVIVVVSPAVAPTIDSPSDIWFEEGETGWSLIWTAFDDYPAQYQITRDGILVKSGNWDGSQIYLGISTTLESGVYQYVVTVSDSGGHMATNTVMVEVASGSPPVISTPLDIDYEQGATGNIIVWSPSDARPNSYSITRNGVVVKSGIWTGADVSIAVDGLSPDLYNYQITVYDKAGNSATDTVKVIVNPSIVPLINSPDDFDYEVGSSGHSITWTPFDVYPSIYSLLRDGEIIDSGSWNGDGFIVDIDGLTTGDYIFTLSVADLIGNTASDDVTVSVSSQVAPTIDNPDDIIYQMGESGYVITWNPMDLYPDYYNIYRNDTLIRSGSWDGASISIGVDGLSAGVFIYEITVYDKSGSYSEDQVQVTVEHSPAPELIVVVSSNYEYVLPGDEVLFLVSWMNIQQGTAFGVQLEIIPSGYLILISSTGELILVDHSFILDIGQVNGYSSGSIEVVFLVDILAVNGTIQWLNSSVTYYDSDLIEPIQTDDGHMLTIVSEQTTQDIHTASWWKNQFNFLILGKTTVLTEEQMHQLVTLISESSEFFVDVNTCEEALDVLRMVSEKGLRGLAARELYGVWLNLANDALTAGTEINLENLTASCSVGEAILECEAILMDSLASVEDLVRIKNICISINHGNF